MKEPVFLTDDELKHYADEHIGYELTMLSWCTGLLIAIGEMRSKGYIPLATHNAVLNSYSMHSRNLIDFLYLREMKRDRDTDIVVQDYIEENALFDRLIPITKRLCDAKKKADKQVAHLTRDRMDYIDETKSWDVAGIVADIYNAFRSIRDLFPEKRTTVEFRSRFSDEGFLVPRIDAEALDRKSVV